MSNWRIEDLESIRDAPVQPASGIVLFFLYETHPENWHVLCTKRPFQKERIVFQVSFFKNYIGFTGGVCCFLFQFYVLLDGCFRNPAISVHWTSSERVMKIVSCNSLWILFFWMKHPRPSWVSFTVPFDGCHDICQYIGHRQDVPKNHPANKNAANLTRISNSIGAFQLIFVGSFSPTPKKICERKIFLPSHQLRSPWKNGGWSEKIRGV